MDPTGHREGVKSDGSERILSRDQKGGTKNDVISLLSDGKSRSFGKLGRTGGTTNRTQDVKSHKQGALVIYSKGTSKGSSNHHIHTENGIGSDGTLDDDDTAMVLE